MILDWRPPTLETPRLVLRPLCERDLPAVFAYASDPRVTRFTLFDTHKTLDDSRQFVLEYAVMRYAEKVPDPLGIVRKDVPHRGVVGALGCFWASQKDGVMELGYCVGEPDRGCGFAVEAAGALVTHAFAAYPVERCRRG